MRDAIERCLLRKINANLRLQLFLANGVPNATYVCMTFARSNLIFIACMLTAGAEIGAHCCIFTIQFHVFTAGLHIYLFHVLNSLSDEYFLTALCYEYTV